MAVIFRPGSVERKDTKVTSLTQHGWIHATVTGLYLIQRNYLPEHPLYEGGLNLVSRNYTLAVPKHSITEGC